MIMNQAIAKKRSFRRYNIPVIGHFADRSVRFNSIIEAEEHTGISYTLIFEACIGKIYKARNVYWEFENGTHYIKYKAYFLRAKHQIEEEGSHPKTRSHAPAKIEQHTSH
jgi:hypothetical protein